MVDRALLVLVVVLATVAMPMLSASSAVAGAEEPCDPEMRVVYDEFRFDNSTVSSVDSTGDASVEKRNTLVEANSDEAFVRLDIQNPNSYCVEFEIQLSEEVVDPATLGTISTVDSDYEADWRAVHDWDRDETYTEVTIVVDGGADTTIAPSTIRVKSLSWTGQAKEESGAFEDLADSLGLGDDLEKRHYDLEGEAGETVTIPLTNPDDAEQRIEEWHATYSIGGKERPMGEDASDPVFYRVVDDGDAVEIHYNEDAEVQFTANPTLGDQASYEISSYSSSWDDLVELPFLGVIVP